MGNHSNVFLLANSLQFYVVYIILELVDVSPYVEYLALRYVKLNFPVHCPL